MKLKIALLFSLLLVATSLQGKDSTEGTPKITFSETSHDFGVIREDGGAVSYSFEFTNTGSAPLLVLSASASCGCTRPDYPKDPVKVGKKSKIKVTFNPLGRAGEFSKTVTVRTNAKGGKKINLKIKGNVTPSKKSSNE
jgi:hypothetical protein